MREYEKVIDAIEQSTQKWIEVSHNTKHDAGSDDCALCDLFKDDDCDKCPIANAVDETACYGTPFEKWFKHQYDFHHHIHWKNEYRVNNCNTCKQIALEEALFIYSLTSASFSYAPWS